MVLWERLTSVGVASLIAVAIAGMANIGPTFLYSYPLNNGSAFTTVGVASLIAVSKEAW